jgi:hypothetical protein
MNSHLYFFNIKDVVDNSLHWLDSLLGEIREQKPENLGARKFA